MQATQHKTCTAFNAKDTHTHTISHTASLIHLLVKNTWETYTKKRLSPYLFITAIELLSHRIAKCKNITGINIRNVEFNNTLFADDLTFITNGSKTSFESLINILDEFKNISDLKLNNSKCTVLEGGSLKFKLRNLPRTKWLLSKQKILE